jgi:hypothetical protein
MRTEGRYRFIGTDGSLGFRKGRVYSVSIDKPGPRHAIEIRVLKTTGVGIRVPYGSENSFGANWQPAERKPSDTTEGGGA